MPKLTVHAENYDSNLTNIRKTRIEIGNKTLTTPSRALNLGDHLSESRLIKNKKIRGINEIYKNLTSERIEQISNDTEAEVIFNKKLKNILNKSDLENELNFPLLSFENKNKRLGKYHNSLPTEQETGFICDVLSHLYLDVIIPPRLPELLGETYLKFLHSFFDTLETRLYNKPVIGFLPFVTRIDLPKLIDFYISKGVFSFVVDFQRNNPIDIYTHVELVHNLVRKIKREYDEEVYLHACNVPFTRIKQKIDATPAKDIVTFLLGFDSFGTNHLRQKLPLEVVQKIREKAGRKYVPWTYQLKDPSSIDASNQPESFRIFNRNDYGYYRSDLPNIRTLITSEEGATINLEQVYDENMNEGRVKSTRKAFNVERHALEAVELQKVISENLTLEYLQDKRFLKDKWTIISKANA